MSAPLHKWIRGGPGPGLGAGAARRLEAWLAAEPRADPKTDAALLARAGAHPEAARLLRAALAWMGPARAAGAARRPETRLRGALARMPDAWVGAFLEGCEPADRAAVAAEACGQHGRPPAGQPEHLRPMCGGPGACALSAILAGP